MTTCTDRNGEILGFRCHDGSFLGIDILGSLINLRFRRLDASAVRITLRGVRCLAINDFREGNIVDAAYLWPTLKAPGNQRRAAALAFSCQEESLDRSDAEQLFVLESSYGAGIFAVVTEVDVVELSS